MEAPLALKLEKKASLLHELKLLEYLPIERIKAVLHLNILKPEWGQSPHEQKKAKEHANEKIQIEKYLGKYSDTLGGVPVVYKKSPQFGYGRAYPEKSIGLTSISRKVRNTMINGLYYDFDLKNAQPSILLNLCKSNEIECDQLERYCREREDILVSVQTEYGVDRDTAKDLFLRICFLGSFQGWCLDNNIRNKRPLPFITLFQHELNTIAERIRQENPRLRKSSEDKNKGSRPENFTNHNETQSNEKKNLGSFFALYNQEYESRIVEKVLFYLINNTPLLKHPNRKINEKVGTYEYDGIKLLKENVDNFGGSEAVVNLINSITREITGFPLEWVNKEIEGAVSIENVIALVSETENPTETMIKDMKKITDAIEKSDTGIIETIMEILPNHFRYSVDKHDASKGEWYGWDERRWIKGDAPLRKAIIYKVPEYWFSILEPYDAQFESMEFGRDEPIPKNYELWKKTKDKANNRIFQLNTNTYINSIVSVGKTLMLSVFEFDTNPNLVGYENGVFDIEEYTFRPYRFDDYITMSCGYPFVPYNNGMKVISVNPEDGSETARIITDEDYIEEYENATNHISETFQKIMPDRATLDYLLCILSTGLSGKAIEGVHIFNGNGRNGKGLTNEFMAVVLGEYCEYVSAIVFCEDPKKKSSNGPNPEIAKLDKKRYVIFKEPPKDLPLQNSTLKDFTGGGKVSARMCHSSKSSVILCMTLVGECNSKPPFAEEASEAEGYRFNDILFGSTFTPYAEEVNPEKHIYEQDPSLKDLFNRNPVYINAMANILLGYLQKVKENDYKLDTYKPDSVRQRSMAYIQTSYDIHNIFIGLFEPRQDIENRYATDEDWTITQISKTIRTSTLFRNLPKHKQKEFTAEKVKEFLKTNQFYKRLFYHKDKLDKIRGWRLKPIDEDEEV